MKLCLAGVLFWSLPLLAADADMSRLLKKIETRYNSTRTLQVQFQETYTQMGRKRVEAGDLFLRKPGRMRWQYTNPAGKLFISDGKSVYLYSADSRQAEKMKLKETEDMRAPLAFLLGKLEFERDFQSFQSKPDAGGKLLITALPKSDKLPYREVSFLVDESGRILRLVTTTQDAAVLQFDFANEQVNPKLADTLFQFKLPPGAEFIDTSESR